LEFFDGKVLDRRVAAKKWRAEHRGVYVTHNGPLTAPQRLWAASLAVGNGKPALLGGLSALHVLGLRRFESDAIHILLPPGRKDRDPPPAVRIHRTSRLPDEDTDWKADPPCTLAPRSVVDAAQWARTDKEARTIIAMSFQQRLVGGFQVHRALERFKVIKRRALIASTAADAMDGSETVTELDLLNLCREEGLPLPSRQVIRKDASGRQRYLDAYFDEWGIRVEVDGAHHMEADQWWSDMQRHNDLSVRGEVLLRFPAWMVRDEPAKVAAHLRQALLAAGWRP
jgi:very-short-patch-repair endonuclease